MKPVELPPTARRAIVARIRRQLAKVTDQHEELKAASPRVISSMRLKEGDFLYIVGNTVRDAGSLEYLAEKFGVLRSGEKIEV